MLIIYYRKPRLPNLDEYSNAYRGMIAKDIISLINGNQKDKFPYTFRVEIYPLL